MAIAQRTLDLYYADFRLVTSKKSWRKLNRQIPVGDPPTSAGYTIRLTDQETARQHVTVWVDLGWHDKHPDSQAELLRTCIHEATHAAAMVLDGIGQAYDGSSEPLAYLVEWIASWLWAAAQQ